MNKLITNTDTSNFYNYITKLFNECSYFTINVAFINFSGIQLLLDTFSSLNKKNIRGRILTSTYLNFTEIKALEKILEFENIELKIYDCNTTNIGFHSKAYIFEFNDIYEVIIGSSNITSSAFKRNIEWNMSTTLNSNDQVALNILKEFDTLWNKSYDVTEYFIDEYSKVLELSSSNKYFNFKKEIKMNSMQVDVINKLKFFRKNDVCKSLVIAATGTGKTYLAAFDVLNYDAKRVLFLVHRENILIDAKKCFENIIDKYSCGLYTGNKKEIEKNYIFSTIQTMTKNYKNFKADEFDYIVVDEAHHVTSKSYLDVLEYFNPKFLLGLTATPNRMDNESIYDFFDDNIACDIRLAEALDKDLIVPFHYYGISDIKEIDYESINYNSIEELASLLMINKRVDFIIEKMNFYNYDGKKRKVLAFCVSKKHAMFMSDEFNKRGINSTYLTSSDSVNERVEKIQLLEDDSSNLEVIFSIDIFNEGIDIPCINMILMLRPTNSSIVFIQQLGRGLRKHKDKKFLTVLDFIGNHNRAFLVALALSGNKLIDKESVKLSILDNFSNVNNSFIYMDEISKNRILNQIKKENFNNIKYLKEEYLEFKNIIGNRIPKLTQFLEYDNSLLSQKLIDDSKSYIEFLYKVEKINSIKVLIKDEIFIKIMRSIEFLLPIKRIHEFIILKELLENDTININQIKKTLTHYIENVETKTIIHACEYLNHNYYDKAQVSRYEKLLVFRNNKVKITENFKESLLNYEQKSFILESLNYGILLYEKEFGIKNYGLPFFKLYEKYNMLNIAQLCNFNKIHSSFRGSGFLKFNNDFFLFISIEKDKFSLASKYNNSFISNDTFTYISKPLMSQDKGDGEKLINNIKHDINLHIFVRKFVQVDKKTQSFIYLGLADTLSYWGNKPISMQLKLRNSLSNRMYEEFIKIIN